MLDTTLKASILGAMIAGLVSGCAFSRIAFVSYIELDGVPERDAGFRQVAILDTQPGLELWPDCYQEARASESMSVLVPIPPSLDDSDRDEKVMADQFFGVSLKSPEKKTLSVNDIRITIHTANGSEQLVFDDKDSGSSRTYNPVYHYASTLRCSDIKDARLTIDGVEPGKQEMDMNFVEENRRAVAYQGGFHT